MPVKLTISPGQTHDILAAAELLDGIGKGQMALLDRAYDADWLRAHRAAYVLPTRTAHPFVQTPG